MHGQHLVEDFFLSVEGEAKVTDTAGLAFLQEEVHDAIVDIAPIKLIHTASNGV